MPDITMCSGEGCHMKDTCYRYTAEPSPRQSYFAKPPIEENGTCGHWEGHRLRRLGLMVNDHEGECDCIECLPWTY